MSKLCITCLQEDFGQDILDGYIKRPLTIAEIDTPLSVLPPDSCIPFECDHCRDTFVDKNGLCVWPNCTRHGHRRVPSSFSGAPIDPYGESKKAHIPYGVYAENKNGD